MEVINKEYSNLDSPDFDKTTEFTLTKSSLKEIIQNKPYLVAKTNAWLKQMKDDFQIYEGINILRDMNIIK